MIQITPSGKILGATLTGIDLACPLVPEEFALILRCLGEYGVLRFPGQRLSSAQLRDFSARFGHIQRSVTGKLADPEVPEVGILSNIVENGQPIGLADAGQDWHTDMSYNETVGFLNVLYAVKVPVRDGKPLGATLFANMHAAYEGLDPALRQRLEGMTATHDFNKFWEKMRTRPGSIRPPLTPEQRRMRPPSVHPIFLAHPLTGRRVLYCNPGYVTRINELDEAESERVLAQLFAHQLQDRYIHTHTWTVNDVLVWDHFGTLHNAIPDYGPNEPRLMKRCQVMADRVFEPGFLPQELVARNASSAAEARTAS